jgi:hypothetical protein
MDIEVGHHVAWDFRAYMTGRAGEGLVVAKSGNNLAILNEKFASNHPDANPFSTFKIWEVYRIDSLMPVGDPTFGHIVDADLNIDAITHEDTDIVLAHFATEMADQDRPGGDSHL